VEASRHTLRLPALTHFHALHGLQRHWYECCTGSRKGHAFNIQTDYAIILIQQNDVQDNLDVFIYGIVLCDRL
jgi:hypothetical protein